MQGDSEEPAGDFYVRADEHSALSGDVQASGDFGSDGDVSSVRVLGHEVAFELSVGVCGSSGVDVGRGGLDAGSIRLKNLPC